MKDKTEIHVVGNATDDATVFYTNEGRAVINFTIADNQRWYNQETQQWVDGETTYWRISYWPARSENPEAIAEHVKKGQRVSADGHPTVSSYRRKDTGEVVPAPRVSARIFRPEIREFLPKGNDGGYGSNNGGGYASGGAGGGYAPGGSGGGYAPGGSGGGGNQGYGRSIPENDPWLNAPPAGSSGFGQSEEPPF